MHRTLASLAEEGRLPSPVRETLERALDAFATVVVCGGSDAAWAAFFPALTETLAAGCHAIVVPPPPLDAAAAIRAALRQDPDAIVIDRRGREALELLWHARMTGHQVVLGLPAPTAAAALPQIREAVRALVGGLDPEQAATLTVGDALVLVELSDDPGDPVRALYQARPNGTGLSLAPLPTAEALVLPGPPALPAEDYSEMAVPESWPPRSAALVVTLREAVGGATRTTWAPRFEEEADDLQRSRFGGRPLLLAGEALPTCGACGAPLQLVAQLALATLPPPAQALVGERGWFQLFYCISDHCTEDAAWEPFSANRLVRALPDTGLVPAPSVPPLPEARRYGTAAVVEWVALQDAPGAEDRALHGIELTDDEEAAFMNGAALEEILSDSPRAAGLRTRYGAWLRFWQVADDHELLEIVALLRTHAGDKLLGWPAWTQGPDYPGCPACEEPMALFLQINNDGHEGGAPGSTSFFPQLFAADGNGHVFVCPQHRDRFAFSWACG